MAKDKMPLSELADPNDGKIITNSLASSVVPDALSEFEKYRLLLRGDASKVWRYASLEWVSFCNNNTGLK